MALIQPRVVANASSSLGDRERFYDYQQQNIDYYQSRGDLNGEANALQAMGITAVESGDYDRAIGYLATAVERLRQQGDRADLMLALNALGLAHLVSGDYAAAEPIFDEALDSAQALDIALWESMILGNLGHLKLADGRLAAARADFDAGETFGREANSVQFLFQIKIGQATLALLEGNVDAAGPPLDACLRYYEDGDGPENWFVRMADVLALKWAMLGRADLALRLIGRAEAVREAFTHTPRYANVQPIYDRAMTLAAQQYSEPERDAYLAWGRDERNDDLWLALETAEAERPLTGSPTI